MMIKDVLRIRYNNAAQVQVELVKRYGKDAEDHFHPEVGNALSLSFGILKYI